jgi:PadR family transcriptional regulator, regulatory protein PadR
VPFAGTENLTRSHFETRDSVEKAACRWAHPAACSHRYESGLLNRLAAALDAVALNLIRVIACPKLRILGMGRKAQKNDSLPGSLDMLILRTLSLRSLHGYGIVQFIQQSSENELLVEEGSLYPALQRLELHGWIDGIWGVTSNNRRARIYKITPAGRKQLAVETRKYSRLTLAIARVMGGA